MKKIVQALAMAATFLLFPAISWAQGSASVQAISDTERPALFPTRNMIEFGKTAAEANCAGCHGLDGISDAEGKPHLAGQRTVYIYRVMKAFQSGARRDEQNNHNDFLNEQALLSTSVYYSSLSPVQLEVSEETSQATQTTEVSEAPAPDATVEDDPFFAIREPMRRCIKCHGESGNASGRGMPASSSIQSTVV